MRLIHESGNLSPWLCKKDWNGSTIWSNGVEILLKYGKIDIDKILDILNKKYII